MKSLTVKQPWAFAIAHLGKQIENREWSRSWRGQIAIHAGKGWDTRSAESPVLSKAWDRFVADLPPGNCHHGPLRRESLWKSGTVIAVATLADICTVQGGYTDCQCGPWAVPFQCHWHLTDVRPLSEPVPAKGALGLWTLPDEVEAAVLAQLGAEVCP